MNILPSKAGLHAWLKKGILYACLLPALLPGACKKTATQTDENSPTVSDNPTAQVSAVAVQHDADNGKIYVYLNSVLKGTYADRGNATHYFNAGCIISPVPNLKPTGKISGTGKTVLSGNELSPLLSYIMAPEGLSPKEMAFFICEISLSHGEQITRIPGKLLINTGLPYLKPTLLPLPVILPAYK